jgi:hypothetical protein
VIGPLNPFTDTTKTNPPDGVKVIAAVPIAGVITGGTSCNPVSDAVNVECAPKESFVNRKIKEMINNELMSFPI